MSAARPVADPPRDIRIAPVECDEKIVRSKRQRDPLAFLHHHGSYDQAQFDAGRIWQAAYEERDLRSRFPDDVRVSGGQHAGPINDRREQARKLIEKKFGELGLNLIRDVLADGKFPRDLARERCGPSASQRDCDRLRDYYIFHLGEILDRLAVRWGF